jgi:transposase-like protein
MVRLFTALCKTLLENLCAQSTYQEAISGYSYRGQACPCCGAIGKFSSYGDYSRGLVDFKGGKSIDIRMKVLRFECLSCNATHALIPDIVIPYGRYATSFVLRVLIAYFERKTTVVEICEQFGIAVSTIYAWIKRMALHKELMLGLLISQKTPALSFLRGLLEAQDLSAQLRRFFRKFGFSFMQGQSAAATRSRPP